MKKMKKKLPFSTLGNLFNIVFTANRLDNTNTLPSRINERSDFNGKLQGHHKNSKTRVQSQNQIYIVNKTPQRLPSREK